MKIKADHYFTLKETHNHPKGVNLEEVPYQGGHTWGKFKRKLVVR